MSLEARVSVEFGELVITSTDNRIFTVTLDLEDIGEISVDFGTRDGSIQLLESQDVSKEDDFYFLFHGAFVAFLEHKYKLDSHYANELGAQIDIISDCTDAKANDNADFLGAVQVFIAEAA